MEKNYAYEIETVIKDRFKEVKKDKEEFSLDTKKNLLKLVNNCKNTKKIEYIYKFRYAILNRDIAKPELINIYEKLFKKILNTDENSIIFTEWNNIFSTIFGNIPVIYDNAGLKYINNIIDLFCDTNNDNKLRCLMNLFISIYNVEKEDFYIIKFLLNEIQRQETDHILDNYNMIIKNLYKFTDNEELKKYFNYIIYQISDSKSKLNSEYLNVLLEILINEDNSIEKEYLIILNLLRTFSTSKNMELISAYHALITNNSFIKSDSILQNKCILLLKKISEDNFMKIRLVTEIILNIIIVCDNKDIENYLLNKLLVIKNNEVLELLLKLEPVLSSFTDTKEFIRVIDSLEDNSNNLTKKLVINLENE